MSWWKRSPKPQPESAETSYPQRIPLVPEELDVYIHRHELPVQSERLPCWTYVTEGLSGAGQAEISMTVLRAGGEEPPRDPLRFFESVHALARQGKIVQAGHVSRFAGDEGPFGRQIAYIRQLPLAGIELPVGALMAISVTAEELEAVLAFGILRVMARLGRQATYYPCPPWIDRARTGLSFARTASETLLSRVPRLFCPGMRVMQIGKRLNLRLSPAVRPFLTTHLASLAEDAPIAFLADLDPAADGLFVWQPGQSTAEAIAPAGSRGERVCCCFIVFAPIEGGGGGGTREDGATCLVTVEEWRALRRVLCEGGTTDVHVADGNLPLEISWDDGWVTYYPESPRPPRAPGQRAWLEGVQLLTAEPVLAANTTGLELGLCCQQLERAILPALSRSRLAKEFYVRFTFVPGTFKVDFAARGDLEIELREEIHRAFMGIKLRVEEDPIEFQLHFIVAD
jgi:hypothetical protein